MWRIRNLSRFFIRLAIKLIALLIIALIIFTVVRFIRTGTGFFSSFFSNRAENTAVAEAVPTPTPRPITAYVNGQKVTAADRGELQEKISAIYEAKAAEEAVEDTDDSGISMDDLPDEMREMVEYNLSMIEKYSK